MKKPLQIVLITSIFIFSGLVMNAQAQVYIGGNIGLGMPQTAELTDDELPGEVIDLGFDNKVIFSGALGYAMNNFRAELELAYQKNNINTLGADGFQIDISDEPGLSADVSSLTGLLNGYYDFNLNSNLVPYLTAGIGLSKVDVELALDVDDLQYSENDDDSVLAFQLGGGLGYMISENIILDLRYRYLMADDPEFGTATAEYKSHNITGGLRVNF